MCGDVHGLHEAIAFMQALMEWLVGRDAAVSHGRMLSGFSRHLQYTACCQCGSARNCHDVLSMVICTAGRVPERYLLLSVPTHFCMSMRYGGVQCFMLQPTHKCICRLSYGFASQPVVKQPDTSVFISGCFHASPAASAQLRPHTPSCQYLSCKFRNTCIKASCVPSPTLSDFFPFTRQVPDPR